MCYCFSLYILIYQAVSENNYVKLILLWLQSFITTALRLRDARREMRLSIYFITLIASSWRFPRLRYFLDITLLILGYAISAAHSLAASRHFIFLTLHHLNSRRLLLLCQLILLLIHFVFNFIQTLDTNTSPRAAPPLPETLLRHSADRIHRCAALC